MEQYGTLIAEQPIYQEIDSFTGFNLEKTGNRPKPYSPFKTHQKVSHNTKKIPNSTKYRVASEITRWQVIKTPTNKKNIFLHAVYTETMDLLTTGCRGQFT